ncbi:hypothetical protein L2E82_47040 [Cichorium intybus]|uniref:Uncharacterized protein n=1 Tax=Cichorium intybus TaxID=13427 RepID=A0ACB8YTN1_CICIN|nr:hypothetical protein L2E82_47040 [Cichorium intybus]
MMSCELDPVEYQLTTTEIHEIISLIRPDFNSNSNSGSGSNESRDTRKISNRESARRSRQRKKRHMEELTDQLNQLRFQNRDLKNRLTWLVNQCRTVLMENHQLGYECIHLQSKLSGLCQLLVNMQFQ